MTVSRKALCLSYGIIGLFAFIGAWGNILGLLKQRGFWGGTIKFWQDVLVNEASRFITIDLLFLGLAVALWMVLEARRLKIPGVWLYVIFGLFIAISLAVPLFMIHREIKLATKDTEAPGGTLRVLDATAIIVLGLAFTAFSIAALLR